MLERVAELREPVGAALAGLKTDIAALTSEDFNVVCGCLSVLSPFHEATIELSAEKKVSGSKVVPLLKMVEKSIQEETAKSTVPVARELGELLIKLLRERLHKMQSMSILSLATLLDPRYKALGFFCPIKTEEAIKRLTAECAHIMGSTSRSPPPAASTSQDSGAERAGQYFNFDLHSTLT